MAMAERGSEKAAALPERVRQVDATAAVSSLRESAPLRGRVRLPREA